MDCNLQNDYLWISIERYKKLTNCTGETFEESHIFDKECGIIYINARSLNQEILKQHNYDFAFKVSDEKKYLFAKLKYGI